MACASCAWRSHAVYCGCASPSRRKYIIFSTSPVQYLHFAFLLDQYFQWVPNFSVVYLSVWASWSSLSYNSLSAEVLQDFYGGRSASTKIKMVRLKIFTKIHAYSYLCYSLSRRRTHENDGHHSRCYLYRSCPCWFIRVSTVYACPTCQTQTQKNLVSFLGAIFKKNGFVKSFFILLATVFGFQVGSSIWYLISFYRTRGQPVEKCINGSTDTEKIAACQALDAYSRVPQGVMIASVIVPIIVEGCMFQSFLCNVRRYS